MRIVSLILALGVCFSWMSPALAHPHIFIDYQVTVKHNARQIEGFEMAWQLDAMNSRLILDEFDRNHDGRLLGSEVQEVAQNLRDNLREFQYFTQVKLNNHRLPIRQVQRIRITQNKGRVVYHLFLPCPVPLNQRPKTLYLRPWDETNYVAFKPQAQPVRFVGPRGPRFALLKRPAKMYDSFSFSLAKG